MPADEKDLYEILGVSRDASQADIKKAYIKLALKLHPDKNPGDEEAKSKFQSLQRIYAILKDPAKRRAYDQTGSLEDSEALSGEQFESLYEYYRNIYRRVSEEDIDQVQEEYRGSDEEREDLLKFYKQFKGDMEKVFEWVICSDSKKDSHRFMDIIKEAIAEGKVKSFKAFKSWSKEVLQKPRPQNPLAKKKKRKGQKTPGNEDSALVAAIRNKNKESFDGILSAMEAKYGEKASHREEPSEEEFEAAAARLASKKQKKAKQKENQAADVEGKKKKSRQK